MHHRSLKVEIHTKASRLGGMCQDGAETPNVTGEIHVMTRWLPAEMKQVRSFSFF